MKSNRRILNLVNISLFAIIIAICAWITVPSAVPFTLQTFAVFCTLLLLGGKNGTAAILVYLLLGMVGLPVFSNFKGGLAALLGTTGGYIVGFLFMSLFYWMITKLLGNKTVVKIVAMFIGLIICYTFGTAWFMYVYSASKEAVGIGATLSWCVFPFVIPDLIKMAVAFLVAQRVRRHMPQNERL